MKTIWIIVVLAVLVAVAAIVTKPSDVQCLQLAKNEMNKELFKSTSNPLVRLAVSMFIDIGVAKVIFPIEDKIFYKEVFMNGTDTKLGTVVFGTFFISDKVKESVK